MNSFGLEDAQVLFDTPAGSVAPPRIEARSAIRNQFESSLTVIEVLADLLTVVLAVSGAFFVYQLLQPGSILRPPLGTIALASFAFAGLVVLLLDRDGAYLAGNSLLRIKETERSLRVSFQAFVLVLPAAFFTGHLFSRWIFFIALLILLCYKLYTFVSITLALGSVMQYVEVDEPPPDVFLAPA